MAIKAESKLSPGEILPLFRLPEVNGAGQAGPIDYKQQRNLVLFFFHSAECERCKQLLSEIAVHYGDYREREADVLAISTVEITSLRLLADELALPFPLLSDGDGRVSRRYLNDVENILPQAAIFIADRWGEIFAQEISEADDDMIAESDIREWLDFIEMQCEECFPPEWQIKT